MERFIVEEARTRVKVAAPVNIRNPHDRSQQGDQFDSRESHQAEFHYPQNAGAEMDAAKKNVPTRTACH